MDGPGITGRALNILRSLRAYGPQDRETLRYAANGTGKAATLQSQPQRMLYAYQPGDNLMNRPSEHSLNVSCMKLMMRTCSGRATNVEILYLAPTPTTDDMQPPADVDALLQFQLGNLYDCSLTLDHEITYIWQKQFSFPALLFYLKH
ncbi:hypothetical protein PLEOSDRAFT_165710 [Pleurotus ostreatus PC15]|uniref:DUF6533 domain-containing protein n=1 Tax=Pleurotus ostreatus (strain PC15) TaxID=1137138 RepID=A0A067NSS1_PLEO1|nr:hypothetical protein PLEOSDRAFT_165710 [Pleurotus ostreatus PC15]